MTLHVSAQRLDANWKAITAELDAPRRSRLERMLLALRTPEPIARLLVATPALRRAWFIATGVALFFGLTAADTEKPDASLWPLLVLAPLVPVLGVALAYGPAADPAHEASLATPMSGLRVVLTRTAAVVAGAIAMALVATVLLREKSWLSIGWLGPALALPLVTLALSTLIALRRAAFSVTCVWLIGLAVLRRELSDELAPFRPAGQLAILAVGVAAAVIVVARRESFERLADA